MNPARLLFPAIRWRDDAGGFDHAHDAVERALELGVGGFILFGGTADAVSKLTARLRADAGRPLLIGADLERGAGQQFRGATRLPPFAALGALDDDDTLRRAGELTGREALALGVDWVYAPMADVDVEPRNPIVGTRSLGSDAERVARGVAAWIEGCAETGALSCAKHFPGHGRTVGDSHIELPTVRAGEEDLERDLVPFESAIAAGVDSIMTAHVAYPMLDPEGRPATMSRPIVTGLLRERLGFDGLVVTDALIMEGAHEGQSEADAAVAALAAGCDALLYPDDLEAVAARVREALDAGELDEARVRDAVARVERAASRDLPRGEGKWGSDADGRFALETALRSLQLVAGEMPDLGERVDLVTVDDDVGGPYPPPERTTLAAELRSLGVDVAELGGTAAKAAAARPTEAGTGRLVAVYSDIRAWKGRPGLSEEARAAVVAALDGSGGTALVVLFGHPRLAADLGEIDAPVLAAWGGEALMQRAAARRIARPGEG